MWTGLFTEQHMGLVFVSWPFSIFAFFILGLLLCIWVYRDAQKRGMNGALWLIIVLLANIVGLIIYLVVREPETTKGATKLFPSPAPSLTTQYCKFCGNPLSPDARFCPTCGKEQI